MVPRLIKLAAPTVLVAICLGGCIHLLDREPREAMTGSTGRCTLSPGDLAERKANVKTSLGSRVLERTELDNGIAFRFPTDSQTIQSVFEFVTAERRCCGSFLTFEVILDGGNGEFWLRLRGDKEAKEFLNNMFN